MNHLHRFYISPEALQLRDKLWIDDDTLVHQWTRVLRYKVGDQLVLFDGRRHNRLYEIIRLKRDSCQLQHVTDLQPKQPKHFVHLFWFLLKPTKNDWLLQKCSELGVSAFTPIVTGHTLSRGLDNERARKIIIEAAEQSGRLDIPRLHDPIELHGALKTHSGTLKTYFAAFDDGDRPSPSDDPLGIYIAPEGGWSPADLDLFKQHQVSPLNLGSLTPRAETVAVAAVSKLL